MKTVLGAIFARIFKDFVQIFRDFTKVFTDFARILKDFTQILTKSKLGGALALPPPTPQVIRTLRLNICILGII